MSEQTTKADAPQTMAKIVWHKADFEKQRHILSLFASADGLFEVYECVDHTWRVWFEHGHETRELDVKVRNLPSKQAAIDRADAWHAEWLASKDAA